MKRLFSVLAVALFVCISAVGQNYCDPYLISVNLDSVRLAKVSDEKYLEDLTSMERSVKQNLTN